MRNKNYFRIHRVVPPHDATVIYCSNIDFIRSLLKYGTGNDLKMYHQILQNMPFDFRGKYDEQYCTKEPIKITTQDVYPYHLSKQDYDHGIVTLIKLGYLIPRKVNLFDFYEAPYCSIPHILETTPDHFTEEELKEHQAILDGTWEPKSAIIYL